MTMTHGLAPTAPLAVGPSRPHAPAAPRRPAASPPAGISRRPVARHADGLGVGQRRAMVGAVLAVHVAIGCGLLQIREVREAIAEAAPIFVSLMAPALPEPVLMHEPPEKAALAPTPAPATTPIPDDAAQIAAIRAAAAAENMINQANREAKVATMGLKAAKDIIG